jgi:hypothetical protein
MTLATDTRRGALGLSIVRHFDDQAGPADAQCGSPAEIDGYLQQIATNSHEYYNQPDGSNKFYRAIERIDLYSSARKPDGSWVVPDPDALPTAEALTFPLGGGRSRISMRYYDAQTFGGYKFPAALSHEFGHAYHNWAGFYMDDAAGACQEVARWWEKAVNQARAPYAPGQTPWTRDMPYEQFANAYRYLFGTFQAPAATRGSSGPGTPDPVIAGFEDPAAHPDWRRAFQFLPELCAFVESYGAVTDSLAWHGDQFWLQATATIAGIVRPWVAMSWYYTVDGRADGWFYWNGAAWVRFAPSYTRT